MSANLYIRPVLKQPEGTDMPDSLKFILQKSLLAHDVSFIVSEQDISYFQGLADAGIAGAKNVIAAIQKYGAVELRLVY